MTDAMNIATTGATSGEVAFRQRLDVLTQGGRPQILELGTLQSEPPRSTHHKAWAPDANWTLSDMEMGPDVDVVADAHGLIQGSYGGPFLPGIFDAYIAVSVYEHLARPWRAAEQAAWVLRPGGLLYVATHQTFPLHGYPSDYFRFSDKALALIFEDAGFRVEHAGYAYPCQIIPPPEVTRWNPAAPCYLNVEVTAVRRDG